MTKLYPSDISYTQYSKIGDQLENFKKKTKPREVDLYRVFCGVLYILKTGCQWKQLPKAYPKWRTVHAYYLQWNKKQDLQTDSLLEQILKKG